MTIQKIIGSPEEFAKNTSIMTSQSFSYGCSVQVDVESSAPAGIGAYRKSKGGRLPRSVEHAIAEARSVAFRSEMQEARFELAKEFMGDEVNSLAKMRLERGFSQQQLASKLGTSQPHIANLEAGKIEPQFETVARLADALGISLDAIRPLIESARRRYNNVR